MAGSMGLEERIDDLMDVLNAGWMDGQMMDGLMDEELAGRIAR